jgi:hypothetical protein
MIEIWRWWFYYCCSYYIGICYGCSNTHFLAQFRNIAGIFSFTFWNLLLRGGDAANFPNEFADLERLKSLNLPSQT